MRRVGAGGESKEPEAPCLRAPRHRHRRTGRLSDRGHRSRPNPAPTTPAQGRSTHGLDTSHAPKSEECGPAAVHRDQATRPATAPHLSSPEHPQRATARPLPWARRRPTRGAQQHPPPKPASPGWTLARRGQERATAATKGTRVGWNTRPRAWAGQGGRRVRRTGGPREPEVKASRDSCLGPRQPRSAKKPRSGCRDQRGGAAARRELAVSCLLKLHVGLSGTARVQPRPTTQPSLLISKHKPRLLPP